MKLKKDEAISIQSRRYAQTLNCAAYKSPLTNITILLCLALTILVLGGCASTHGTIGKSICEEIIDELTAWAESGDRQAQFELGNKYYMGHCVEHNDYVLAARWSQKAAEQGHIKAQYYLGLAYEFGIGVPQDQVVASKWYGKASDSGDTNAIESLATLEKQMVLEQPCQQEAGRRESGCQVFIDELTAKQEAHLERERQEVEAQLERERQERTARQFAEAQKLFGTLGIIAHSKLLSETEKLRSQKTPSEPGILSAWGDSFVGVALSGQPSALPAFVVLTPLLLVGEGFRRLNEPKVYKSILKPAFKDVMRNSDIQADLLVALHKATTKALKNTVHAPVVQDENKEHTKPDYRALSGKGINTMIEINSVQILLDSSPDLVMTVKSRIVRTSDEIVLFQGDFQDTQSLSELQYAVGDKQYRQIIAAAFEEGYAGIADKIVKNLFMVAVKESTEGNSAITETTINGGGV